MDAQVSPLIQETTIEKPLTAPVAVDTSSVPPQSTRTLLVALSGQPNVGKSTLFNLLTGLDQHVGNWPGKTVEFKEGRFVYKGVTFRLVDLPGTYSLTANSAEELIARQFIICQQPDVILALADAAILDRSLYLVAELLSLGLPVIVALNMMDVARQEGIEIRPEVLQDAMGVPVVPMVAARKMGLTGLLDAIHKVATGEAPVTPHPPQVRPDHQEILAKIEQLIDGYVPPPYPKSWLALKLLEGDREITGGMQQTLPEARWEQVSAVLREHDDALVAVASGRYEWIGQMVRAAITRPRPGQIGLTERLDRWATHPLWGLLMLAGILGLAFSITYTIGSPLQSFLARYVVGGLQNLVRTLLAGSPAWLVGLLADGVIGGAGAVLTFLPILAIFFVVMSVLEEAGYMARAAYVMDSFMHMIGLHGKSFLPLFLGFGCNVPAVLGTRVIESRRARLLTILLVPLIPCTARMAVVAFLAPAFFGSRAVLVSWGLVLLAILVLVACGLVTNKLLFGGQRSAFIMELPLYHLPDGRTILLQVWQRCLSFIRKAGTLILAVSVVVWALSRLPDGEIEHSILANLGRLLEPIGLMMGFDWRLVVALLTSFIAKENAIATLGVIFGGTDSGGLAATLAATYTASAALAFLTVQMLFIPCVATVAVIRQETGSWRWTLFNLGSLLAVSLVAGMVVYWLARLVGL